MKDVSITYIFVPFDLLPGWGGGLIPIVKGSTVCSYKTINQTYTNYVPLSKEHYVNYNKLAMCEFFIKSELKRNELKKYNRVIFIPNHASFMDYIYFEYGIITGFNSKGAPFVKFFNKNTLRFNTTSQLTDLSNLYPY